MQKLITISIDYPNEIYAFDCDGQWMKIIRLASPNGSPSDNDVCEVTSERPGEGVMNGTITWGKAFAAIQDFMNASQLDNGWNT